MLLLQVLQAATLCTLAAWSTGVLAEDRDPTGPELHKMQFSYRNTRDTDCKVNCTNVRPRTVCGTDGRTYPHKCSVRRLRKCEGRKVRVHSKGKCRAGSLLLSSSTRRGLRCEEERANALSQVSSSPTDNASIYVPECKPDGTYAEVQCHTATGYCWCVTHEGRIIPGSSVRGKMINCRGTKDSYVKRDHHRRSFGHNHRPEKKREGCSPTDRSTFNANLIDQFSEEFDRIPRPTLPSYKTDSRGVSIKSGSDSLLNTPEKRVIEWKFTELDINKDNFLRRKEIRSLKRMVKKLVKPKACAKTFDTYCDLDQDGKVARGEWSVCLGVDINNEQTTTKKPASSKGLGGGRIPLYSNDDDQPFLSSAKHLVQDDMDGPKLWQMQEAFIGRPKPAGETEEPAHNDQVPSKRDCAEERSIAEDMDRANPEGRIFIPECDKLNNAKYTKEQCHKSTGYCWCVNEKSGLPIPGTSTHNVRPDCSKVRPKQIKGCSYTKKKKFLELLLDHLTTEMMAFAQNATLTRGVPEPNPEHTLEEQVVRWKMSMLDTNKNKVLEKREWKKLKAEIDNQKTMRKSLRKCGRNFAKYCADSDNKITLDEWLECTGTNDQKNRNLPSNPKRKGPNPFKEILRSS